MRTLLLLSLLCACAGLFAQQRPAPHALLALVQQDLQKAGFLEEDVADAVLKDHYVTDHSGMQHSFMRQRWQGIEVWNGELAIHLKADGTLLRFNNGAYPRLAGRINSATPAIGPDAALGALVAKEGLPMPPVAQSLEGGYKRIYEGSAFGGMPVTVQLVYWPVDTLLRLAWAIDFSLPQGDHWWEVMVDAMTGAELNRADRVLHCAFGRHDAHGAGASHVAEDHPEEELALPLGPNSYRVYAPPVESPNHGNRSVVTSPWLAGGIASPYGWHDTDGQPGAEYIITRGNNVLAQADLDGYNTTPGHRPSGGAALDFDFPINLGQDPSMYLDASITNLFFWNNHLHDVLYAHGFTEASGNFQQNNYGRGGVAGDMVLADAQDGSGMNNANFATPVDGVSPRMQMFIWDKTAPRRCGDLDNGIIAHEYGHGLSNRLVGGASNVACLQNREQMGEGWSDYIALMLTMKATDTRTTPRGIGTYVLGQPANGTGIRPAPYSTNMGLNPYTYASTNLNGGLSEPHGIGFVWCTMLWEMTWDLIDLYGFDPDPFSGNGGNNIALRLVVDGMKLTPCSPGFVQARDAILAADQAAYNGAHQALIRTAFARRGLGWFAEQGSSYSRDDQVESFVATPVALNVGVLSIEVPKPVEQLSCGPYVVSVKVRNNGTQPTAPLSVGYQLGNGPVHTVSHGQSIAPGATATITFPAAPLTISTPGSYSIRAFTSMAGDQLSTDNELVQAFTVVNGQVIPHQAAPTAAEVFPPGWSKEGTLSEFYGWVSAGVEFGTACEPDIVWSKPYSGEQHILSPYFTMPSTGVPSLRFHHAYVPRPGLENEPAQLRVDVTTNCGASWTTVFQDAAPSLNTAPGNSEEALTACGQWRLNTVGLSAYLGQTVRFRFTAIDGYVAGRIYLDDILLLHPVPVELALESMASPPVDLDLYCPGLEQPVSVGLINLGTQPQGGFSLAYRVNGGSWNTETFPGTLSPSASTVFTFAQPVSFAGPGPQLLEVAVNINDANPANNHRELLLDLVQMNPLNAPPLLLFDADDGITVPTDWRLSNLDGDVSWENVAIGTGSDCGATRVWRLDHNAYGVFGEEDRLVTPTYQLIAGHRATLRFDHAYAPHTDPQRADGFRVQASQDCGATWTTLFEQSGSVLGTAPATASPWVPTNCTQWRSTTISLEAYDGEAVMLRFVAINRNGNRFYLDNIRIDQVPYVNAWVSQVVSPAQGGQFSCGGSAIPVTVEVANRGALPIASIPVRYRLGNGPWVSEVVPGPFAPNAGAAYTFAQPLVGLPDGTYVLDVQTQVPGDQVPADDGGTVEFSVLPSTPVQAPYLADAQSGAVAPPGWVLENPDGAGTWANVLLSMGPECASTRAWTRNFVGDPNVGEEDRLITPWIDLGSLHGARLKFDHAYSINPNGAQSPDALQVQVSTDCGLTWTTVFSRSGSALATAPNSTAMPWVPTNCSHWSRNSIDLSAYDGQVVKLRFVAINGGTGRLYMDNVHVMNEEVLLSVRVLLEGPYGGSGLMNDNLRLAGLIPGTEPYTALGFQRVADPGATTLAPSLLSTTGSNAVVDWVLVELRSPANPSVVKATRCVLVQRDGDVMRPDNGITTLRLPGNPGAYHVAVRHRNHLGVMTAAPVFLGTSSTAMVDFSTLTLAVHGTEPLRTVGTRRVMWAGNAVPDASLRYVGESNDRDPILVRIGGSVPTNTLNGYWPEDVNLDGVVKYVGQGNDRDPILTNIGGSVPTNMRWQQLP